MKKLLALFFVLLSTLVFAHGETNSEINEGGMMMGNFMDYGMMGTSTYGLAFWAFLSTLLLVGLTVLVYLWILKLWRELFYKK